MVGYEVFYEVNGSSTVVSVANTTNTMLNITSGLSLRVTYDFFVVSYDDITVLPSNRITTILTFSKRYQNEIVLIIISANPGSINDLTVNTTSTTVTLTWNPPDIVPQSYYTNRTCHRLCEQSNDVNIFNSIISPYQSSGIDPNSVCTFLLYGVYGSEQILLATISATTLSTGNIQYLIQSFSISIYSSYFICQ